MESSEEENTSESESPTDSVKPEQTEKTKSSQTISSSTRLMRNLAEKMRRDKLNMHISDLASIVPMVATATKRVDKTSVLRLSAAYLRIHQNLMNGADEKYIWQPCFLHDINLSGLLLEAVNGFLLVVTLSGKIIYVSEGIDKLLGHSPVDVLGHSLYTIIHPDDCSSLKKQLQSADFSDQRRSFWCHMTEKSLSRNDCGRYSLVHVIGHVRTSDMSGPDDEDYELGIHENLLIAIVKVIRSQPIAEISWLDGCHDEYITQHSMDGRIVCADHRISIVAGYLPDEVVGKSAYEFMYPKDRLLSVFAHRLFLTDPHSSEAGGTAVYRLVTRSNSLIFLKTQGIFQISSSTGKAEGFICINRILNERDGRYELQSLFLRYTPSVTDGAGRTDSVNTSTDPSSKSLKWTTSSCSDSSEVPEIPSTLEEEQWSSLPVPFPLSFLPSNTPQKIWADDVKPRWQDITTSEAAYAPVASISASRGDDCRALYACKQSPPSPQYSRSDFPNEKRFDNVTSTTSDNDLATLTDASSNKDDYCASVKLRAEDKGSSTSKRATKRRAQENGNEQFPSSGQFKDYELTSKILTNGSGQGAVAQTPLKKRCNRVVEKCSTRSVYNISKTNRSRPR